MSAGRKREFLERIARERPEYRDILEVFREIFSFIEGREEDTGIRIAVPSSHRAERTKGGFPLVSPEDLGVDRDAAAAFLAGVIGAIRRTARAGEEDLSRMEQALASGALDLPSLFPACLGRRRDALEKAAGEAAVPPPLLVFVLEVPLKTALSRFAATLDPAAFGGWDEGHCPVCGGRAGMDELVGEEGRRLLSCSGCFFQWPYKRVKCPYCGSEDPDRLSYFTAGEGPVRVGVCRACGRYIKTRDSRRGHADVPLEAEDLATLHLDLLAGREGFDRGR